MSKTVEYNATGIESVIRLYNSSTKEPAEGVTVAGAGDLAAVYRRDLADEVSISLVDGAIDDDWTEGAWKELGSGYYAIDIPDAAWVVAATATVRGVLIRVSDTDDTYTCTAAYHPLQRVVEAVSFTTDGGLYAEAQDLYDVFGQKNVYKWANIESLAEAHADYETDIQARITKAITFATADINDKLRGGPYAIPFTTTTLTASINQACTLKAGVWLYEWRGADDYNYEDRKLTHRYSFMMDRADKVIEELRRDARRLGSQTATKTRTRAPGVITE